MECAGRQVTRPGPRERELGAAWGGAWRPESESRGPLVRSPPVDCPPGTRATACKEHEEARVRQQSRASGDTPAFPHSGDQGLSPHVKLLTPE
jgi:hypothetical protein